MSRMTGVTYIAPGSTWVTGSDDEDYSFDREDYPRLVTNTPVAFIAAPGNQAIDIRKLSQRADSLIEKLELLANMEPMLARKELEILKQKSIANVNSSNINVYDILKVL